MKFTFKIQQYQTDAVGAVARVFQGQPYNAGVSYLRDIGNLPSTPQQISVTQSYEDGTQVEFQDALDDSGFKNEALQLTDEQILRNIQSIQMRAISTSPLSLWLRWEDVRWISRWKPARARPMFTSKPCSS